jgi:hypothetical protein
MTVTRDIAIPAWDNVGAIGDDRRDGASIREDRQGSSHDDVQLECLFARS